MKFHLIIILLIAFIIAACAHGPLILPESEKVAPGSIVIEQEPKDWQPLLDEQIATVRKSLEKYKDFNVAKREGWKPFGGEAPLMGMHYSNKKWPDYVYGDKLDFSKPNNHSTRGS